MEQYLRETMSQNNINKEEKTSLEKWKSLSETTDESEKRLSADFDCNICLDTVQDPVVTLCGHLYCWPCIYKWIHQETTQEAVHPLCPVCRTKISQTTIVPLYVPGSATKPTSGPIPRRPATGVPTMPGQRLSFHGFQQVVPDVIFPTSPASGMFGEMVYERLFGNAQASLFVYPNSYSVASMSTRRARRRAIEANRSLGRVCFFLLCCVVLCLFLF